MPIGVGTQTNITSGEKLESSSIFVLIKGSTINFVAEMLKPKSVALPTKPWPTIPIFKFFLLFKTFMPIKKSFYSNFKTYNRIIAQYFS